MFVSCEIRTHAHRSGLRPERSALDHSAKLTSNRLQTNFTHNSPLLPIPLRTPPPSTPPINTLRRYRIDNVLMILKWPVSSAG